MWAEITRPKYERSDLRYATDVTDAEWALIASHLPAPRALARIIHIGCDFGLADMA